MTNTIDAWGIAEAVQAVSDTTATAEARAAAIATKAANNARIVCHVACTHKPDTWHKVAIAATVAADAWRTWRSASDAADAAQAAADAAINAAQRST